MGEVRVSETQPELTILTDGPQPTAISTFNEYALRRPGHVVKVLGNMLAGGEPGANEFGRQVRAAVQTILELSGNGRHLDYDDHTWAWVVVDPQYREHRERLDRAGREGPRLEEAHAAITIRGLMIYTELSQGYQRSLQAPQPQEPGFVIPAQPHAAEQPPVVTAIVPDYT